MVVLPSIPFNGFTHVSPTHIRLDGLIFGVMLAYLQLKHWKFRQLAQRYWKWIVVLGLSLVLPLGFLQPSNPFVYTIGYTFLYLGYGLVLTGLINKKTQPSPSPMAGSLVGGSGRGRYLQLRHLSFSH